MTPLLSAFTQRAPSGRLQARAEGDTMVRLRIHAIMKKRGITAYALSKGTDLSYPSAYRLSRAGGVFGRLHAETLDMLCHYFHLQPGKLLEWVPDVA